MLEENMVFTIEPILTLFNNRNVKIWDDKWTWQIPFNPSAQFEHMIRVSASGNEILTQI